jgi:hypothetical protein
LVNYLIDKKSIIPEKKLKMSLWFAAENNLEKLYNYVLQSGLKIKKDNDEFCTLLHLAASGGGVKIVQALISEGFDPNQKDKDGWTPFHYAASQGKINMIKFLLKNGVKKNSRNRKGETAYHLAVFREFSEAAKLLKDMGVDSSKPKFPVLRGKYMGQKPPDLKPRLFLPGIVSGHYHAHSPIVFSVDGKEACWTEMYPPREKGYGTGGVMTMKVVNRKWTLPKKSKMMRGEPFFSPDGKRLYFISREPLPGKKERGKENIWYMEKTKTGWSDPVPVDETINSMNFHWLFSLDKQQNLFFSGSNTIYRSEYKNGKFEKPVDISKLYNNKTLKGFCPFISPNGDYLLFSAPKSEDRRNIDLYVSFNKKNRTWTDRKNLGENINATGHDIGAVVTPDGKYIFFGSVGKDRIWGIYWVSAKIIEKLKPKELKSKEL